MEDEEVIRDLLMMVFAREGFETVCACTVAEAMERLEELPSHVTLDLHLPDARGTEVLRRIREQRLPIQVAVTTGTIDAALLKTVSTLRPDRTFYKPFRSADLVEWVRGSAASS